MSEIDGVSNNTNKTNTSGEISELNTLRKKSSEHDAFIKKAYDYIEKNVSSSERKKCYRLLIMFVNNSAKVEKDGNEFKKFLSKLEGNSIKVLIDGVKDRKINKYSPELLNQLQDEKKSTSNTHDVSIGTTYKTNDDAIDKAKNNLSAGTVVAIITKKKAEAVQVNAKLKIIKKMPEGEAKKRALKNFMKECKALNDEKVTQQLKEYIDSLKPSQEKKELQDLFKELLGMVKDINDTLRGKDIYKNLDASDRDYVDNSARLLDKQIAALDLSIKETKAILSRENEMQRNMMGISQSDGSNSLKETETQSKDQELITKERIEEFRKTKDAVRLLLERFNAETAADKDLMEKAKETSEFIAKIAHAVSQLNETIIALSAKNLSDSKEFMKILQGMIELVSDEKKNTEAVKDLKDLTLYVQKALKDAIDSVRKAGAAGKTQAAEMKDALKALFSLAKTVGEMARLMPALMTLSRSVEKKDMEKLSTQLKEVSQTLLKCMDYLKTLLSYKKLAQKGLGPVSMADMAGSVHQLSAAASGYIKKLQRGDETKATPGAVNGDMQRIEDGEMDPDNIKRKGDTGSLKNDLLEDVEKLLDKMLDKMDPESVAEFIDKLPGYARMFTKELAQDKLNKVSKAITGNRPQTVDKIMGELKTFLPEVYLKLKATLEQHIMRIMNGTDDKQKENIKILAGSSSEIKDVLAKLPQGEPALKTETRPS